MCIRDSIPSSAFQRLISSSQSPSLVRTTNNIMPLQQPWHVAAASAAARRLPSQQHQQLLIGRRSSTATARVAWACSVSAAAASHGRRHAWCPSRYSHPLVSEVAVRNVYTKASGAASRTSRCRSIIGPVTRRFASTSEMSSVHRTKYAAVVVGGGPAGITVCFLLSPSSGELPFIIGGSG